MPIATEAAGRIMAAAKTLAAARGARQTAPLDLLLSILEEESRGSELLTRAGLDRRAARDAWETASEAAPPDGPEQVSLRFDPADSPELSAIVEAARRRAIAQGRHAELGSEHLVAALAEVDSPARRLLETSGVTLERLLEEGVPSEETDPVPLPTDFTLEIHTAAPDRPGILRALDAASNRASEGLRVVEDFTRFVQNDAHLTSRLKRLRHRVGQAIAELPSGERLANRDAQRDVGAELPNASARNRKATVELAGANVHRAQEALRALEEFGRLLDSDWGSRFEAMRYELYTLEKAILTSESAADRLQGRDLYLLLTADRCRGSVEEVIRGAVSGGVGIVQIREKNRGDAELLELLSTARRLTRENGALLIVNDRPDLAVLCEADGVHVGQDDLPVWAVRRIVGGDRLIGVSTHSIDQARAAVLDGADYLGVGPVFPSQTKAFDQFAGLAFVEEVAAEISLPWFALGGIDAGNAADVRAAGARRIAVSNAICQAADPRVAAGALRE